MKHPLACSGSSQPLKIFLVTLSKCTLQSLSLYSTSPAFCLFVCGGIVGNHKELYKCLLDRARFCVQVLIFLTGQRDLFCGSKSFRSVQSCREWRWVLRCPFNRQRNSELGVEALVLESHESYTVPFSPSRFGSYVHFVDFVNLGNGRFWLSLFLATTKGLLIMLLNQFVFRIKLLFFFC